MPIMERTHVQFVEEVLFYHHRLDPYTIQEMMRQESRENGCDSKRYRCLQLLCELAVLASDR